jgi:hypothetical protein
MKKVESLESETQQFLFLYQDDLDSESSFQNRNVELKSRITELLTTLEKVKRNSELRQQQSDELIKDLKSNQRFKHNDLLELLYSNFLHLM